MNFVRRRHGIFEGPDTIVVLLISNKISMVKALGWSTIDGDGDILHYTQNRYKKIKRVKGLYDVSWARPIYM